VGSATPVVPVTEPGPVTMTADEAEAAGEAANAHAGLSGADLDALVRTQPLAEGTEPIPSSLLVGAWSQVAPGPRAALAKKILGTQDWATYEQIVYPSVVLTLFAADVAAANGSAPSFDAAQGTSACETFKNAVFGTIDDVFAAIGRFEITSFTGNVFTDILTFIRNIGALIGNAALDGARIVLVTGVQTALGPIVSAIATVATIAAVAGKIVNVLQPWTASFALDPLISRRDTAAHPGTLTLTMKGVTGKTDWPDQLAGCARSVNVELPSLKPSGGKLDWTIPYQHPAPMIAKQTDTPTLDQNGSARLTFETLPESPEVAAGEERTDGIAHVLIKVHRTDLDKLHELISRQAVSFLPAVAQQVFGPALLALVDPQLEKLLSPLTQLRDQSVTAVIPVNYHGDPEKPGTPTPKGKLLKLPKSCPGSLAKFGYVDNLGSWNTPGAPAGTLQCGYAMAKQGTHQLHIVLFPVKITKPEHPDADPVPIPGTSAAWIDDHCSPSPCFSLDTVVADGTLRVIGGDASRETIIAIAKFALGAS
jgi:hypothetical protein